MIIHDIHDDDDNVLVKITCGKLNVTNLEKKRKKHFSPISAETSL